MDQGKTRKQIEDSFKFIIWTMILMLISIVVSSMISLIYLLGWQVLKKYFSIYGEKKNWYILLFERNTFGIFAMNRKIGLMLIINCLVRWCNNRRKMHTCQLNSNFRRLFATYRIFLYASFLFKKKNIRMLLPNKNTFGIFATNIILI